MAGTPLLVAIQGRNGDNPEMPDVLRQQINNIVGDLERLRSALQATLAKLDADAGVTDTNYASLQAANVGTAATMVASLINDRQ